MPHSIVDRRKRGVESRLWREKGITNPGKGGLAVQVAWASPLFIFYPENRTRQAYAAVRLMLIG
jgi:hypothetical protein